MKERKEHEKDYFITSTIRSNGSINLNEGLFFETAPFSLKRYYFLKHLDQLIELLPHLIFVSLQK